jgi:DNA-damage-inducible protein D
MPSETTPFETIRRTNSAGNEFWSSRDFAKVLGYADYRNFQSIIEPAHAACFNSGQRVEDHFVEVTAMIEERAAHFLNAAALQHRNINLNSEIYG